MATDTQAHSLLSTGKLAALIIGPLLVLVPLFVPAPADMPDPAWRLVGLTAWMVVWWLSEVVPLAATSLLPLPFMPLLVITDADATASSYADPLIFLFLGGFLIAAAMQRWDLHRRIALNIVNVVGTSPARIIGGFMLATAFLSMWISNTATSVMMFAVGIALINYLSENSSDDGKIRNFGVALMLGIAYSASIGGVATLIGTPPNALLASFIADSYDVQIGFATWMLVGLPIVVVMLPVAWFWLTHFAFSIKGMELGEAREVIEKEIDELGEMSRGERVVLVVFVTTALLWILRSLLSDFIGLAISDTAIAIAAGVALMAIPLSRSEGTFVLDWETARTQVPWGVLLLFGGGLALAGAFQETGLAEYIGAAVEGFQNVNIWWIVLIVSVLIILLTELTSNTATTATFLPIMGAIAVGLGQDPLLLAVPTAIAASMAFMMPVATPPNAIVFGYKELRIADMVKAGAVLNLLTIAIVFAAMYFLVPLVFGLQVGTGG